MTLNGMGLSGPLRVTEVLCNGKRRFDPVEKERLIEAALEPRMSVAGLALAHGINANQLRNWIRLRRRRQAENELTVMMSGAPSSFVPVVEAAPIARSQVTPARSTSPQVRLQLSICLASQSPMLAL